MPRGRHGIREAAAFEEPKGRGCFSAFLLPPFTVLLVGVAIAVLAFKLPAVDPDPQAAAPGAASLSPIFTPQVQFWRSEIIRWASTSGLDPNLLAVIMQIESCGDPFAISTAGASGLFQVMPYHFLPTEDPYAPETNAARGTDYLRRSLAAAHNDVRLALAGYNGGIGVISRPEWFWSAETSRYAYWGSGIYQDAVSGAVPSPRLDEWLAAGGKSLCSRAGQRLRL